MKLSTVAFSDYIQFSPFKNREHGSTTTRCKKLEEGRIEIDTAPDPTTAQPFNLYLYAGLGNADIPPAPTAEPRVTQDLYAWN